MPCRGWRPRLGRSWIGVSLAVEPGTQEYRIHSLVRDWVKRQWSDDERKILLRRAAQYWQGMALDSHALGDLLRARHYWLRAGSSSSADDIVQAATEPLMRWGQWGLRRPLWLLRQSVETVSGQRRAVALGNLANMYQNFGDYTTALKYHEQVLEVFEGLGDRGNVAVALHQIGVLHYLQGEYPQALEYYQRSLKIREEIGDRVGVAASLHQIGMLHQGQGEYPQALDYYQRSLKIFEEMATGVAWPGASTRSAACIFSRGSTPRRWTSTSAH